MSSIERKVWIFDTKETPPTKEDTFEGQVLSLHRHGYWVTVYYGIVAVNPDQYIKWMQYPDLVKHKGEFTDETN